MSHEIYGLDFSNVCLDARMALLDKANIKHELVDTGSVFGEPSYDLRVDTTLGLSGGQHIVLMFVKAPQEPVDLCRVNDDLATDMLKVLLAVHASRLGINPTDLLAN